MMTDYTDEALVAIRYLKGDKGFIQVICETSRYLILEVDIWIFRVTSCGLLNWGVKIKRRSQDKND